jgi:hypothetical protein
MICPTVSALASFGSDANTFIATVLARTRLKKSALGVWFKTLGNIFVALRNGAHEGKFSVTGVRKIRSQCAMRSMQRRRKVGGVALIS